MELGRLLDRCLRATSVVGASLGVLSDGSVEVAHAGLADRERSTPIRDDTRFQIASVTKPMVATVVAKLADEGRLRLDDTLAGRIPELHRSGWGEHVTILDLLANRGSVPLSAAVEFDFDEEGDDCLARLAAVVATQPLTFPPGSAWSYNNTGWCLLGRVIEAVCGATWEVAMRSELFDPLDMNATGFISEGPVHGAACCYNEVDGEAAEVPPWRPRALGPAGATVWSTVADLFRFARVHLEDGELADGSRLVRPDVLAGLREVEHTLALPDFMDAWCRGWACWDWPGGPLWGWVGIAAGHRAVLKLIPHRNAAVVLTTCSSRGRDLYRHIFPPLLADRFDVTMLPLDRTPLAADTVDLDLYAGTYAWPDYEVSVTRERDCLRVSSPEFEADAFPVTERVFALTPTDPDFPVVVFESFADDGRPQLLYHAVWAYPRVANA